MSRLILFLFLLSCSTSALAQDGTSLLPMIERESKEKAPDWIIEHNSATARGVMMSWRSGEGPARLVLMIADSSRQADCWYKGVEPRGQEVIRARGTRTKLRGFGVDAFFARDFMKKDWMVLGFRRGKVFAQIYAPTEAAVRMFAQLVYKQIIAQSNKRLQLTAR